VGVSVQTTSSRCRFVLNQIYELKTQRILCDQCLPRLIFQKKMIHRYGLESLRPEMMTVAQTCGSLADVEVKMHSQANERLC
jgi:hypothetical protein